MFFTLGDGVSIPTVEWKLSSASVARSRHGEKRLELTIYCDIDGTLTDTPHQPGGEPRYDVIKKLKLAISRGHDVILWSGRKATYVRAFAKKHGIEAVAFLSKPELVIDDKLEVRHLPKEDRYKPITPEEFLARKL